MKVTIIVPDRTVYVDGKVHKINVSGMPSRVRAVQWDSKAKQGHIEYDNANLTAKKKRKPNVALTDFSDFQVYLDRWQKAEDHAVAVAERFAAGPPTENSIWNPETEQWEE